MSEPTSIDTTGCEREPIHIPGAIQPHGALLAFSLPDRIITQVAGQVETMFGHTPDALLGRRLVELFDEASLEQIHEILEIGGDPPVYALGLTAAETGAKLDGVVHVTQNTGVVELQPRAASDGDMTRALSKVRRMMAALQTADGTEGFLTAAAAQVRAATGFDRVMIYRFQHDDSGEVVAEAADERLETFMGLRYPASDIPAQARALYKRNWLRLIDDVSYTPAPVQPALNPGTGAPLDMSMCALRSVSPVHLEYLKNMDVASSMSISIVVGDRLWGLIACHHYAGAHRMSFEVRATCELFGQMFSLQLEAREQAEQFEARIQKRGIHEALVRHLAKESSFADGLTKYSPNLLDYMDCGGVALIVDGRFERLGDAPGESEVRALVDWLRANRRGDVFATDQLAAQFPPASAYVDRAAGVLSLCVSSRSSDFILWFRPEVARHVTWAGNPEKAMDAESGRISPRRSFAEWTETVRGKCEPWTALEVEAADTLRLSLLELVVRHIEQTAEERAVHEERQKLLMAELDHRVKNTLANIQALVAQTSKQAESLDSFTRNLERRIRSMAKAQSLLTKSRWEGVSVQSLLHEELAAYESSGNVTLSGPPLALQPKAALALSLAIHELATNAAKYGALSVAQGHVTVVWSQSQNKLLEINWVEQGGPAVSPPTRRGFGSTLIERALAVETGGTVALSFQPSGVQCVITVPPEQVSEIEGGAVAAPAPVEVAAPIPTGRRVMVVEDSALVLMAIEGMVEDMGWTIAGTATRVDEALDLARTIDTDVAILDVNLDGDTSWDIALVLRARGIPFIFATGYDGATVLPPVLEGSPIIGKPFQSEALGRKLGELVALNG